jgi:ABC-type branched-subunit amino acid transport system ATPase component
VFALAAQDYLYELPIFGGGQQGSVSFVRGSLFGLDLSSQRTYYYLVLVGLLVVVFVLWRLRNNGVGRELLGVRDNPATAASYGVAAGRIRMKAFALAGAIAGFGGALLAGAIETVPYNQEFFLVNDSLVLVAIVVIGGLGSISGAVIGAVWVIGLPAFFPNNNLVALLSSSIGLLVVLMYFPGGLAQIGTSVRGALVTLAERRIEAPQKRTRAVPGFVRENAERAASDSQQPPILSGNTSDPVTAALEVRDITVAFGGNLAVSHVSLEVKQGEVVGLIGANGAGKSTLMNAIGGYVPCRGNVLLRGADVSRWTSARRSAHGLGRTFQGAVLFPELTVRETIELACERRHPAGLLATAICAPHSLHRERQKRSEATDLIDFMGLGRYADHYVSQLSTGTRRIVEMASLLGIGARMLCLDEPTSGVAQREAEKFGPLILQLRQELGGSVLVIEHDMALLLGMSDRVYCLEAGTLLAEGPPEEIRCNPMVLASYLGTDPDSESGAGPTVAPRQRPQSVAGIGPRDS